MAFSSAKGKDKSCNIVAGGMYLMPRVFYTASYLLCALQRSEKSFFLYLELRSRTVGGQ